MIIPKDAEVISIKECATPGGVFRSNKIIVTNKRKVTDDMDFEYYKKTKIPESAFPKALCAVSLMNYKNTALSILKDKVNKDNIDFYIEEWNDFMNKKDRNNSNDTVILINNELHKIKELE